MFMLIWDFPRVPIGIFASIQFILYQSEIKKLQSDVRTLKDDNTYLRSIVSNHQRFLEMYDAEKRANHLIITGLSSVTTSWYLFIITVMIVTVLCEDLTL